MGGWDKYQTCDVIDFLTSEVACEAFIVALSEDGADEEEIREAYQDVERARLVHGFGLGPKGAVPRRAVPISL